MLMIKCPSSNHIPSVTTLALRIPRTSTKPTLFLTTPALPDHSAKHQRSPFPIPSTPLLTHRALTSSKELQHPPPRPSPLSLLLSATSTVGIYNFTNPGAISHNEVLSLYRDIVSPSFTWSNFTLSGQALVIKAERSNCMLDTSKLEKKMREHGFDLKEMEVHAAYRRCSEDEGWGRLEE
jgi:hypothetical protein